MPRGRRQQARPLVSGASGPSVGGPGKSAGRRRLAGTLRPRPACFAEALLSQKGRADSSGPAPKSLSGRAMAPLSFNRPTRGRGRRQGPREPVASVGRDHFPEGVAGHEG